MTQVKEIQSISITNRMVKVLLQALEVGGQSCAQMVKRKIMVCPKAQKCSYFQHYTSRHAGSDEHKLMTRAPVLKIYENCKTKV